MNETPVAETPVITTTSASTVQAYANYRPKSAELLPMPEPLTSEKAFPAIGKYQVTDKEGVNADISVTMDPENKGVVWIEGLPQGKIKAYLKKSPAIYKIPAQSPAIEEAIPTEETDAMNAVTAKKAAVKAPEKKTIPEGTLIYDRDNNTVSIELGTKFNDEDPAAVFATVVEEQPEATEASAKKPVKKATAKAKVAPVKTWKYTGTKVIDGSAAVRAQ